MMKFEWVGAFLRVGAGLTVASSLVLSGCGDASEWGADPISTTSEAFTELKPNQAKANTFYAPDNIVDITINIADAEWTTLKTELPAINGVQSTDNICKKVQVDANSESPDRFPWHNATQLKITDSKNTTNATFTTGVQIKKKSYCGSESHDANAQPSLKIRIDSQTAVDKIGLQYIVLNNSKQDGSLIRQNLGYYLFGLAGVPRPRVNYAKVHVVTPARTDEYIAINLEPIRGSFIENPDNGFTNRTISQSGGDAKAPGDLYEFSGDDFISDSMSYVGLEKVSKIQTSARADLAYAVGRLGTNTVAGLQDVINVDQFAKFWAMEVLLKHWDGYTQDKNNTYIYNDVVAMSGNQSPSLVDFKFIPSGIDQILQPWARFAIPDLTTVATIMRKDATLYAKFTSAVQTIRQNVFSRAMLDGAINTRINLLRDQLISMGRDTTAEINQIRVQLKLARAAAIMLSGSGSGSFYLADVNSGDVIHASSSETNGIYNEVYHRPPLDDASDRWIPSAISDSSGVYSTLVNEAYNRPLYATASLKTPAGHYFIFTEPNGNYPPGEGWAQYYDYNLHSNGGYKDFTATFKLRSTRTSRYAHFSSSDLTPAGRPRVYQGAGDGSDATNLFMY